MRSSISTRLYEKWFGIENLTIEDYEPGPAVVKTHKGCRFEFYDRLIKFTYYGQAYRLRLETRIYKTEGRSGIWPFRSRHVWYGEDKRAMEQDFNEIMHNFFDGLNQVTN